MGKEKIIIRIVDNDPVSRRFIKAIADKVLERTIN